MDRVVPRSLDGFPLAGLADDDELFVLVLGDEPVRDARLSAAEREVMALVAEGATNAEIAARRGVSVRTVANQVASAMAKLGATSRFDAVARLAGRT